MSDPAVVAQQAEMVAAAWSPPGAPASWALTARASVLRLTVPPGLIERNRR